MRSLPPRGGAGGRGVGSPDAAATARESASSGSPLRETEPLLAGGGSGAGGAGVPEVSVPPSPSTGLGGAGEGSVAAAAAYEGDGGVPAWEMVLRLAGAALWLLVCTAGTCCILLLLMLLPGRRDLRIATCNHYGTVCGKGIMWLIGSPLQVRGQHHAVPDAPSAGGSRQAIFVSNHCSALDIVLCMWLTPPNTVAIAKKEIIFFPLFGLLYLLSGHVRVDRSNQQRAVESMRAAGELMREEELSTMVFPEGTRARDGRLMPFKKGVAHLAIQTRLPVVPIVLTGTHRVWPKGRMLPSGRVPVTVTFLPPVSTLDWATGTLDAHLEELQQLYRSHLPADQLPLVPV